VLQQQSAQAQQDDRSTALHTSSMAPKHTYSSNQHKHSKPSHGDDAKKQGNDFEKIKML
jgi:hypothetical protein